MNKEYYESSLADFFNPERGDNDPIIIIENVLDSLSPNEQNILKNHLNY